MKRTSSIAEFCSDPVGRYSAGATHLVWCHSGSLVGTVHWSRPSEQDARELVARIGFGEHPAMAAGFSVLMDARGMEAFDWPAFEIVSEFAKSQLPLWSRLIRRHAIVVPTGSTGAIVAGLIPLLGPDYPLKFFASDAYDEAVAWLERPELRAVLDRVTDLADNARGTAPILRQLRDHLDRAIATATIEGAAAELGMSTRTLQRELHEQDTQFSHELMHARVRAALQLLEHSDEKIEAIARRVGCSSSSYLSQIFCRVIGETPAEFRARRRQRAE